MGCGSRPLSSRTWLARNDCCVSLESSLPLPAEEAGWIEAAQGGDRSAFARLVDAYWARLHRWLHRLTGDRHAADDLTQETFLKALAALHRFQPGTHFRAWLFRIGHNNYVNFRRADRRTRSLSPLDHPAPQAADNDETMHWQDALKAAEQALAQLPEDFREPLLLRILEGLSFREVALITGTQEETVRWRVFKARQRLLEMIPPDFLPPGVAHKADSPR